MGQKPIISPDDIIRVKNYMYSHHCGYKNAQPRRVITDALQMEDRYFREVCSQIPEIITSIEYGYWILPLTDVSGLETMVAKQVIEGEDRRRIIALYLRNRRQRIAIKKMQDKERQMELAI